MAKWRIEVNTISFLKRKWQQTKTVFWPQVMKVKPRQSLFREHTVSRACFWVMLRHIIFWLALILNPLNHSFPPLNLYDYVFSSFINLYVFLRFGIPLCEMNAIQCLQSIGFHEPQMSRTLWKQKRWSFLQPVRDCQDSQLRMGGDRKTGPTSVPGFHCPHRHQVPSAWALPQDAK